MKRAVVIFTLALLLLGMTKSSFATSCTPITEQYFVHCERGTCTAAFRITQTRTSGLCGRRDVVEEITPPLQAYLVELVRVANPTVADGVLVLRFSFALWAYEKRNSLDSFGRNMVMQYFRDDPDTAFTNIPIQTVVDRLNAEGNHVAWTSLLSSDPSATYLEQVKKEASRKARWEFFANIGTYALLWGLLLGSVAALVHSTHVFFIRLYRPSSDTAVRFRFLGPLLTQVAIMMLAFSSLFVSLLGMMEFHILLIAFIVLVPAVFVAWLTQGWALYRNRRSV